MGHLLASLDFLWLKKKFLLKKKIVHWDNVAVCGFWLIWQLFNSFSFLLGEYALLGASYSKPKAGKVMWAGRLGLVDKCSIPREGTNKYLGFGSNFMMFGFCTGTRLWVLSTLLSYGVHLFQEKLYKMKILYCHSLWLLESHTNTVISYNI